jgi:adenosylhomocysteine nucleosidase
MRIGIVVALSAEASCLAPRVPDPGIPLPIDEIFTLILSGMGPQRAADSARRLVDDGAGALLAIGTAGSLLPSLHPGDLLIPDIVSGNTGSISPDPGWRRTVADRLATAPFPVRSGPLTSVHEIVSGPSEKLRLRHDTGAAAVDMESAAVLGIAQSSGLPGLVLRAIADTSAMRVPRAILEQTDEYGRTRLRGIVGALLGAPWILPDLVRLGLAFRSARATLTWLGSRKRELLP